MTCGLVAVMELIKLLTGSIVVVPNIRVKEIALVISIVISK